MAPKQKKALFFQEPQLGLKQQHCLGVEAGKKGEIKKNPGCTQGLSQATNGCGAENIWKLKLQAGAKLPES